MSIWGEKPDQGFTMHWYRSVVLVTVSALIGVAPLLAACPQPAVRSAQPSLQAINDIFEKAGIGVLGPAGPALPLLKKGAPSSAQVPATVPCILLKAIGYTESRWQQFKAAPGAAGPTLISFDCGYGIMQVTSGMRGGAGFDPKSVAGEFAYNIGTGARILVEKWNITPGIGERDPEVAEDWYFAVWAYNGFSFINNPNNPRYDPNRPPFTGKQPRGKYPYQELVWGYAANPPGSDFWAAIALSLPDRNSIPNKPRTSTHFERPKPFHSTGCITAVPTETRDESEIGNGPLWWLFLLLILLLLMIAAALIYYWLRRRSQAGSAEP